MSIKTDAQVIRDETVKGANTALRVGTNLVAIADDLIAKQAELDALAIDQTEQDAAIALNTNKRSYPLADENKLAGIEAGATADQDLSSLALKSNVLEKDNETVYAPTTDYHPATKKYVDDNAGVGGGTMATTTFTPYLTITSTDGQAAVEELKDELDAAVIASGTDVAPMSYTTVGGETTWAIGQTIPSQHKLFINGLKVIEGVDYTIAGTTITYIGTILAGEVHELYFDIAVPTTYNASEVSIADAGTLITATNVEDALQENRTLINANTAKVTNATHTGEVTGATALTIQPTAISGKSANAGLTGTEEVLINNAGTLEKTTTQAIADLGGVGGALTTLKIANDVFNEEVGQFTKQTMLPTIGLNSYNFYRVSGAVLSGNIADFLFPMKLKFSTTATAGTLAFQRGNQVPGTSITLPFVGIRTFKINSNVTDSRFFIGYSNLYKTSNPTNIDLTTQTQSIGVCKIDTSDNLHFTYNDDSGLATLEDLGVDYPAKNTIDYKYKLIIESTTGSNFILTLVRIDSSGVEISTTSTPISNIPTAVMNAALWITNNATATIASLFDLGLVHIIKNY